MKHQRILIVDDDAHFADAIARRCRAIGYDVDTANSPLAAIASLTEHPPDLVCLDVNMPTGNGLDICEYIVREHAGAAVPVIILTGATDQETIYRSVQLRTHYVRKSPELWPDLRSALQAMLPAQPSDCAKPGIVKKREELQYD